MLPRCLWPYIVHVLVNTFHFPLASESPPLQKNLTIFWSVEKIWFLSISDMKCKFAIFRTEPDGNLIAWVLWKVLGNLINAQIIARWTILNRLKSKRSRRLSREVITGVRGAGCTRWPNKFPALCGETFCERRQEKLQSFVNSQLESLFHAGRSGQELWVCSLFFLLTKHIFKYILRLLGISAKVFWNILSQIIIIVINVLVWW